MTTELLPDILDSANTQRLRVANLIEASGRSLAPHQIQGVLDAKANDWHWLLWWDPRTGKTLTALAAAWEAGCRRILVVAPSIAAGVWRAEARLINFPLPIYIALDEDLTSRAKALKDWLAIHPESMIITNYSTAWRPKIKPILMAWKPDAVISDEVQELRNHTSKQSKAAHLLANLPSVHFVLGLGRAITNGVQDLFSIYRVIDSKVFPKTWSGFRDEYLILGYFNNITGSRNDEAIQRVLAATSSRVTRAQVWGGLPNRLDQDWPVLLSDESAERYRKFAKEAVAILEGTDSEGNRLRGTVSADLVLTQAMRMQQLVAGHTRLDNGKVIDLSSEKIDTATELTLQAVQNDEQVVLWCAFRREIARLYESIAEALPKRYAGAVATIQGGMTEDERDTVFDAFHEGKLRVLINQVHAASKSRDMAEASLSIVVSTGYDLDDFDQLRQRLTGIDPSRSFAYYYLQATLPNGKGTIDDKIYKRLRDKQAIAGRFSLEEMRSWFTPE